MLDNRTKRQIDSARDILVGKVPDPKAQIDQITTAMIYKFMDDMDKEAEELGGKARFFADTLVDYSWTKLMDTKLSGDERINLYKEGIEKLKLAPNIPELFRNIFKNYYLPFYDQRTLSLFLKEINEFSYDNSENLGNAFEYLLSILGSQGDAGQFRTPRHIIDFIVEVIDPKKNETILDPACGTAGFLISAYKHILKKNSSNYNPQLERDDEKIIEGPTALETVIGEAKSYTGDMLTPDDRTKLTQNIAGYDIDSNMVKLALVNLYLHGFPNPKITEYDTLSSEKRWDENFDVILANPPFMTPKGGIVPHKRFSIQANRAEVLFVDYIAEHLSIRGRAGIIVPEGIIFQSANAYKNLRKNLIENWGLYAVVSLPSGVFNPYSGVKTSILLLDKEIAKRTDEILFLKVENDGFDLGAQRRKIDKNDLPDCLHILNQWKKERLIDLPDGKAGESSKFAFAVKKEKIADLSSEALAKGGNGDYNLTGDRYRETVDYSNAKWTMVELGEVCNLESGSRDKGGALEKGIPSIGGEQINSDGSLRLEKMKYVSEGYFEIMKKGILRNGDVLVVKDGATTGKVAYFNNQFIKGAVNEHVFIFRAKEQVLPYFLFKAVQSQKFQNDLQKYIKGIIGGISLEIKQIQIPLPPLSVQEQIVAEIEQCQKVIDGAKQVVENWKPSFRIDPSWEMVELGEVCENHDSKRKPVTKSDRSAGKYPYYGASGIVDYVEDYIFDGDYLLISEDGANLLARSTPIAFSITGKNWVNNHAHILKFDNMVTQKFVEIYINIIDVSTYITGMAQPKLNQQALNSIKIPLPPLAVQEQIVAEIEAEQKVVNANKELMEKMQKKVEAKIGEVWGEEM